MSGISTHVLDTARGRPAAGVAVVLESAGLGGGWAEVSRGVTDDDPAPFGCVLPARLPLLVYRNFRLSLLRRGLAKVDYNGKFDVRVPGVLPR